MNKLTAAERNALLAVSDDEVVRIYRAHGNVLRGPRDVSSRTLWSLDRKGYIMDGRSTAGCLERPCRQVLTPTGLEALSTPDGHKT